MTEKKKKGNFLIWIGILMLLGALGLTVYNRLIDYRAGEKAAATLTALREEMRVAGVDNEIEDEKQQLTADDLSDAKVPDYVLNPQMDMPVINIDGLDYIGTLQIPSLNVEFPVCSEWSDSNLNEAPCRYCGSLYLDDLVICAHNYERFFGKLKDIRYGEKLIFIDIDGHEFEYEVIEVENLDPSEVEQMKTGDWDLTVFTCTKGAGSRITVRCARVSDNGLRH